MRLHDVWVTITARLRRPRPERVIQFGNGDRWVYRRGRWHLDHASLSDEERASIIDDYRKAGLL